MLRNQINDALKEAMKAKEAARVSTLRLIMAALKDRDIAARGKGDDSGIDEDEILNMLQTMIRQRRDSVQLYREGKREELALKEEAEIGVIEEFLPKIVCSNSNCEVVDKSGNVKGYISNKELQSSLTKS